MEMVRSKLSPIEINRLRACAASLPLTSSICRSERIELQHFGQNPTGCNERKTIIEQKAGNLKERGSRVAQWFF
jgi:hypothetical protein